MRLLPGDVISDSIAFTGLYDLGFTRYLWRLAKNKGGHLVDVGANLGYFSLLWAVANPANSVTAFEASPRNLDYLRYNVATNDLSDQIDIRSEAVAREKGEMEFDLGPEEQTGWGRLVRERSERSSRVPVVRLDDALQGVDQIALLKIDIEGADTWAILGAERLFREKRIAHVYWEQSRILMGELGIREEEAPDFLCRTGYEVRPCGDRRSEAVNWYATRR